MATTLWRKLFGGGTAGVSLAKVMAEAAAWVAADLRETDPMTIPTVVAGRQLIADTTAMLPMVAFNAAGDRVDTPKLLTRPDPQEPARRTIEKIVNSLTGRHGNAWLRKYESPSTGQTVAVRVINPNRVTYRLSTHGDEIAQVWIDGIATDMRTLVHIPFIVDDSPVGVSPLDKIYDVLADLAASYTYARRYYTTDAPLPPYAIMSPTRLNGDAARELSESWARARIEGRPAVLSGGLTLETFNPASAADALMLEAQNALDSAIARALLIPPSMLNVESHTSLTYSTTVGEMRRWLATGLAGGYLSRIEAAFTDLLPRGTSAVFDTSNLVRMDFAARISTLAESVAAGIHTNAEARVLEGLPAAPVANPVPVAPNSEGL